jgi:hypothetical protein
MIYGDYINAGSSSPVKLFILSKNSDVRVRRRVAENPHSPYFLLMLLLQDESPEVRLGLADNPGATPYILGRLVHDRSVDVRYGLAENPHFPLELLNQLSHDDNPYVAYRAKSTLSQIGYWPQASNANEEDNQRKQNGLHPFYRGISIGRFDKQRLVKMIMCWQGVLGYVSNL